MSYQPGVSASGGYYNPPAQPGMASSGGYYNPQPGFVTSQPGIASGGGYYNPPPPQTIIVQERRDDDCARDCAICALCTALCCFCCSD